MHTDELPDRVAETFAHIFGDALESVHSASSTMFRRTPVSGSDAAGLPALALGGELVGFREGELLGQGGMGTVHAAHDEVLRRTVAIKRPRTAEPAHSRALVAEARTLAGLEHPNIIPVHALGRDPEGRPVLVMKRVAGRRWSDLAKEGADIERDLRIALAITDALRFVHQAGTLHRDVKPDNVMVGEFGEVYLMDWGCARPLEGATTEAIIGTPSFMAPEMTEVGQPLSPSTDVYLLAGSLQRVLTGSGRHIGRNLGAVLAASWVSRPAAWPADFPTPLAAILDRACDRDPARRYPDAAAFAAALRDFARHRQALAACADVTARLPALTDAVTRGAPSAETLAAELRVELRTVLRAWPDAIEARTALAALYAIVVPAKLAAGEIVHVEALLHEAPEERDRWRPELERAREAQRAAALVLREADTQAAVRERRNYLLLLVGGAVLTMAVATGVLESKTPTPDELVVLGVLGFLLPAVGVIPFRRHIFATTHSRSIVLALLALVFTSLLHRVAAAVHDTPVEETLRADCFIQICGLLIAARLGEWRIGLAALPYALAAATMLVNPELASRAFPAAAVAALSIGFWAFFRRSQPGD